MNQKCVRCKGFLVFEPTGNFYIREEQWKCINCGARSPIRRHDKSPIAHATSNEFPH